ncbi:MAG TPA: ADP-ribosylglycohydrolase family protein [Ktedonobacteraceae bacterium]|nr:ADP-ribosylglycohydrolase family protein [Ktedonobacteraceae bacterium]
MSDVVLPESEASSLEGRATASMFGLAFGDSFGARTEFLSVEEIVRRYPPAGPETLTGFPASVTDDTQMALAVGEALLASSQPYSVASLEKPLREAFIAWSISPENNRAPGTTCLDACSRLEKGLSWQKATVIHSKGCGANMRVAPVGLLPVGRNGLIETTRAAIAQFQGALTHGHPTALAASDLTSAALVLLQSNMALSKLPEALLEYAQSQRTIYHGDWLSELWKQANASTPEAYIAQGWDECIVALKRLETALAWPDRQSDPCLATGAGWIAEEALATGLYCLLLYPDEPVKALQRAATTSGDSDSIACLTGAFAGARYGKEIWPEKWYAQIEYANRLTRLGDFLEMAS